MVVKEKIGILKGLKWNIFQSYFVYQYHRLSGGGTILNYHPPDVFWYGISSNLRQYPLQGVS